MKYFNLEEPHVTKPIVIAAMQDMGNVGNIVIDFINKSLESHCFRYVCPPFPNYVIDKGGHIEFQPERWEYRYGSEIIEFGGGISQPQTNEELYELCQDVIDIAKKYSAQLIYTVGAPTNTHSTVPQRRLREPRRDSSPDNRRCDHAMSNALGLSSRRNP